MSTSRSTLLCRVLVASAIVAAACAGKEAPPATQAAAGKRVDAANTGSISGKVTFAGTPPAPAALRMSTDPACVQSAGTNPHSDTVLVGADGTLQNTFV